MNISKHQTLGLLKYLSIFVLSGCATSLPPYLEPDPAREPTARLRTVILAGVSARVSLHKNNNSNMCLIENEAVAIPVHTNVSGFAGESKKKIGMPFIDANSEKFGSEIYIPAKNDLTLSASFIGSGTVYGADCRMAFRFKPLPGKNYQLSVIAGQQQGGRGVCILDLQEIDQDLKSKKLIQRDVVRSPVAVKGSSIWNALCKDGGS